MSNDKDVTTSDDVLDDLPDTVANVAEAPSSPQKRPGKWEGLALCGAVCLLFLPVTIPSLFLLYYGASIPAALIAVPISIGVIVFFTLASGHDLMDLVVSSVVFAVMTLLLFPTFATARMRAQAKHEESRRLEILAHLLDREAAAKQPQRRGGPYYP